VLLDAEGRGLKPVHGVTCGAISAVSSRGELSLVVIHMTIRTFGIGHLRFEIAARVAVAASYRAVLAEKGKGGLGVIETFELGYARPVRGVVAGLARSLEATLVRIDVAAGATGKREARILGVRFGVGHRNVAFVTGHSSMRSGQLEFGGCVVESRRGLPALRGVALRALRTHLPAMLILVAADARTGES